MIHYPIDTKGAQSWKSETAAGFGAAGASASATPGPAAGESDMHSIAARLALTVFLLIVLVVLAVEAIRLDGVAAPVLGR